MPSTFTTSGVELIADGEQSGLWGQTTNLNLQIIDRMTSQAGTITLSGTTHTLTVSDGALSDGQYGVLVFAGSPSGTNTVTISPNTAQRTYFVRNTTAQSVVLTQGSGGNVTVPSNTSKVVHTNGTGAGAAVFDITNTVAANVTGNAGTATALQTARTIGGVSFNGTANINLPGVNQAGNQNTTGSAASLTTARTFTIGSTGKTFNGTADVAWTLTEIGVNNATLTLATSGIATGSQTFTANQGTNATFTVNVPATNLGYTTAASNGTVTSSTGTNATIPAATTSLAGLMTGTDKTKLDGIGAGASVSSVSGTGTVNGISLSGTVTSSGNLTLGGTLSNVNLTSQVTGTLPVANGGTGITALGAGVATFLGTPTSANLAAAVTNETGSGALVFATSPTLVTPALGTPSSGNLSSCTVDGTNAVGFRTIPQNSQSAAYTLVLADSGKHILHPSADTTARTFTIPANSSVAFPVGTAITFINQNGAGVVTIAITTDTMRLADDGGTGSRTLAANGVATAIKITSTEWIISGVGLT
jgi:hypothetical protein